MSDDSNKNSNASLNTNIGKEIDAALGEVIRSLLQKPAAEAGNLLSDGIGILGDRLRKRRLLNAELGLNKTRAILDSRSVHLKDITPPSEESMHIVLEEMAVCGDARVRELWAGLLAMALDPNESQDVERPIAAAISSLSPADAKVIQFAAFVTNLNREIRRKAKAAAGVLGKRNLTIGDWDRIENERRSMTIPLKVLMETASDLEDSLNLHKISENAEWPQNLLRLGIIRAKPEEYSSSLMRFSFRGEEGDGKFLALLEHIEERVQEAEGLALEGLEIQHIYQRDDEKKKIELGFEFTRFGEQLCRACGLFEAPDILS